MRSKANIDTLKDYTTETLNMDSTIKKLELYSFCRSNLKKEYVERVKECVLPGQYSRNELAKTRFHTIDKSKRSLKVLSSKKRTTYQQSFHRSLLRNKKKFEDSTPQVYM